MPVQITPRNMLKALALYGRVVDKAIILFPSFLSLY